MTYNAFADLDPLNEEYGSNNSFNSNSDMNTPTNTFDSNNSFADLDPGPSANGAVAQPELAAPVTPENDSPNSPVTDFILRDKDSFAGRVNRGIAERASTIGGGLVRFVGQSADELGDWLEEKVPLGVIDISTDGISWRPSTKEDIAQPSFLLPLARDMEGADFGYKEGTTWEDVKNEPLANVLPWALETGLVSVPDMAASILALPAYIASRTGEIGQARTENKGKQDATFKEFLEVLPASLGSSLLERFGSGKMFGINTPISTLADAPKEVVKRGATEGLVEGIQEPAEYAAETIGTNVEFKPEVALERSLQGIISGTVTGTTLAPLTMPGELALADETNADGNPQANSDGSFGTPNPALSDSNAIVVTGDGTVVYKEGATPEDNSPALITPSVNAGEWGVFPNLGGSFSVLNAATGENAGTFDSEQEAESVYQSKVVEASTQELESTIPDAPTSEAPDIAEVEVGINAQRADLDDDLAKIMADLNKPLGVSVPPPFNATPVPEAVAPQVEADPFAITTDDVPQLAPDELTITADDMAQMDLDAVEDQAQIDKDIAAYESSIAATTAELAPEVLELAPEVLELAPELPVAPVKKKLKNKTQKETEVAETAAKVALRKLVDPTKDDLLTAIAKIGGVKRAEASAEGFDPADFQMRRDRLRPVFKAKPEQGISFDAARETLAQSGYIDANSTVNDFVDLLQKAVRGETVVSTANESYSANEDAVRTEDYVAQGGVIDETQAPVAEQDQTITSALEEARNIGLPENEIASILTNYPRESEAVLQLQMSMAGVEIGDSSGSNQAARVGDIRPERTVQQGEGDRGLAGSSTDVATGSGNNESQNVTDEVGVLLSPSAASGDAVANSEAGSGGGIDNAGLSGANAGDAVSLDGSMDNKGRTRIENKLSAMSTKDFANVLKNSGLLTTGTKESKIKRLVDAREGAEAIARFDSFDDFVEAVNDSPRWQDRLTKTTITTTTLLKWANATKIKGDVFSRKDVLRNADNLWGWATASGAITTPRSVEKTRDEGESLQAADQRSVDNRIELSEKTSDSFDLETQSEESLAADTELAATAATEQAAKTKTLLNRAKADAEVGSFLLTGSDAPADVAVANGQDDMFDADPNGTGQDSGKPLFSKSAILDPDVKPKGVTEAQIQARVDVFLAKYKGADDVRVWVRDTQDNAFGPGSTAKDGRIKGGYYPEQDAVVFIAENIDSVQDIDSTIQHELLVHKGLGLFEAKDVKGLVDVINSNAPKSAALGKIWDEVKVKYKDKSPEVQAEELIAKVAEKKMSKPDKYWNKIVTFIRNMLRKIGFVKEISFSDLRKRVYDMGEAFAEGRRAETREGYESNTDTKSPSSDGLSGSKRFDSKKDKDTVRPNPSMIDMSKRSDKKVTSKTSDALPFITNDKDVQAKIPKTNEGDGTADVTIYGVDADGKQMLVAKNRKGGWDIVVDRRVDGEMFADGKPLEYTAKNRKGVADRIESLGLTLEENINKYPPVEREIFSEADSFFMASSTFLERRRFDFQDRFLSALKVQKAIEDFTFEQISEDMDFYNRETLKHGITTAQITEFNDVFIDPMFALMNKNGLSITDVGNFLYARHAPEANAEMKRRNAAFEDNESKSGMSDVDAAKYMADFKAAGKMDILNGIAGAADQVIERTRQILVETGLLSEATVQGYRDMYDVYVPLLGDPMDPDGKIKKSKDESRFGRKSRANNVLINLIVQHEQTIIRGEANVLKRVMLKLVEQNPNPDFWIIDKTTEEKVLDPVTDLFKLKETPTKGNSKHVVPVRVAGEEHLIVFEQSNDHAMMLAKSMNNINAQEVNLFVQAGLKFNRYVSMINTQYNLEFMPTNLARDIQTALINVYQYDDVDNAMVGRITKNIKKSIKGIREYQKGNRDGEMALWYGEFYKNGAQTGWLDNYETMASRAGQLERMMMRKGFMPMDAAYRFVELISDMNTSFENGVRLSTFAELRKAGYSVQKAAVVSKNLTVNFNQKGDKALLAGSLYVFFNASMQGNAAIIQAAQSKAVRKAMLAVFGMQVALEMMNRVMGDDDEDGQSVYSKIPLYIRNNNWVILLPDFGNKTDAAKRLYIKIPVPYGYNVINVAAQVTGAAASQLLGNRDADGLDAGVGLTRIWGAVVHGFNPVGSDASLLQGISFTALDPLAQAATNENFAGQPIRPEQNPYGPPKPNSMLFWKSTPEYIKSISSALNEVSGGTDIRPGGLSISPEIIEHYNSFFIGGAGRFAKDMAVTPAKVVTGQETQLRDYPWIRKFIGQVGDRTDVDNYYKAHTDIAYAQQAMDAAAKTEGSAAQIKAAVKLVEKEEGFKLRLIPRLDSVDLSIASKKLQKASYENDTELGAKVKKTLIAGVDREIRNLRITFVSMYRRTLERQAKYGK